MNGIFFCSSLIHSQKNHYNPAINLHKQCKNTAQNKTQDLKVIFIVVIIIVCSLHRFHLQQYSVVLCLTEMSKLHKIQKQRTAFHYAREKKLL